MPIFTFLLLSVIIMFLHFVCKINLSVEGFAIWAGHSCNGFHTFLTKLILFLYQYKGFCIIIYLDDTKVMIYSKHAGKRA